MYGSDFGKDNCNSSPPQDNGVALGSALTNIKKLRAGKSLVTLSLIVWSPPSNFFLKTLYLWF